MTGSNSRVLVSCRGLVRAYPGSELATAALRGVDLEVRTRETVALVGPSGCGKSTLLHLVGAMDRPDAGTVEFDGRDLAKLNDREASRYRLREVGFVFQFFHLIPTLEVLENVALPARLAGLGRAKAIARARDLLSRVGLGDRLSARPDTLSGGEAQRVALARALVNTPRLILADEPTGALDTRSGDVVLDLLHELVRERDVALLVATHSDEVVRRVDRVLRIVDGRLVDRDPPGISEADGSART